MNSTRTAQLTRFLFILTAGQMLGGLSTALAFERMPNTTLQMPPVPPGLAFHTVSAFPLSFTQPVALRTPPQETNRLFVVEQGGRVYVLTNLAAPSKTLFLDLSKQTRVGGSEGLFALAFHPGFATNGHFFAGYTLNTTTTAGTGTHYRVSRFTVSEDNSNFASTNSELPLITQRYQTAAGCNDLLFGADGYLYISVADPGADSGGGASVNHVDHDLFGGILRIDVDLRPDSLAPNPHPAVSTNYAIPADNPFVGISSFNGTPIDPGKVRTEFYAVGFRNPWRMGFDELTGSLYVGDPGTSFKDEIDLVLKGGNYGWPFREGTGRGPKASQAPPGFLSIDPVYQIANPPASAVIGGLVYRGNRYPELDGAYVFGDWVRGQISMLRPAGTNLVTARRLCAQSGVTAFGLDPSNSDILAVDHEQGRIMRLAYSTNSVGTPLPPTLADTGVFSDLTALAANAGIVPYELNVPFWSDNALKKRWFSLPDMSQTIGFNRDGNWLFPTGTVWIKHFELELTNGVPASARRLETRLLVRTTDGVYGATYRWGDSTSNAVLVDEGGMDETFSIYDGGQVRTQVWHYPSRSECLTCHTPIAGLALGFNTAQLNRDHDYDGTLQNQLDALDQAGYFTNRIQELHTLPALANLTNTAYSLEYRARSYLAANCVQCHQPGGAARGQFDTRLSTPLSVSGLVDGPLLDPLGDDGNRVLAPGSLDHSVLLKRVANLGPAHMPPLATSVLNFEAVALLSAWITNSLPGFQTYSDWQAAHFTSPADVESLPGADPDADGAVNYVEYVIGSDPLAFDTAARLEVVRDAFQVQLTFVRPANRATQVQWTTNLAQADSWRPLDTVGNERVFSATTTRVTITDPLPNSGNRFYRLQILEP